MVEKHLRKMIGLYSGAFSPLHEGHLAFAQEAARTLGLDCVIFLPEKQPRRKPGVMAFDRRIALIRDAIAAYPELAVRKINVAHHSTENVRRELHDIFTNADITLLVGSDVAKSLLYWDDVAALLKQHQLCIGLRGNETAETLYPFIRSVETAHQLTMRVTYVTTNFSHFSSTAIRAQAE